MPLEWNDSGKFILFTFLKFCLFPVSGVTQLKNLDFVIHSTITSKFKSVAFSAAVYCHFHCEINVTFIHL